MHMCVRSNIPILVLILEVSRTIRIKGWDLSSFKKGTQMLMIILGPG